MQETRGEIEGMKKGCVPPVILTPRAMKSTAQMKNKASSHLDTSNQVSTQILSIKILKYNHEAYFCWLEVTIINNNNSVLRLHGQILSSN